MKNILVTGANGFIGQALVRSLLNLGEYAVRATVRSENTLGSHKNLRVFNTGDLTTSTDWRPIVNQVDTIIHCAARAHILKKESNPLPLFRQINCHVTTHLAQEAQASQVRRMIFISSIGVLGNSSFKEPFTEDSPPNPHSPYALSKWEAEQSLLQLSKNMELVIIRPPLVYGPGVKGNFKKLLDLIEKGLPLPLGTINNRRQFVGIKNLIDFIILCINSPKAANQSFLIADEEVVSITELIKILKSLMKKNNILLPIPQSLVKWGLQIMGQTRLIDQLLSNLEINPLKAKTLLGWEPSYSMLEQLQETIVLS
jgi:nucleoside-diphosphate-sugar epimerase